MNVKKDDRSVELAFAPATPAVASSALHGRPLRCVKPKTTSVIRPTTRVKTPRMDGFGSFMEAVSRRGLLNNAITAGFIGAALWVILSPVKTSSSASAAATKDATKLIDPANGKVTSKVFLDVAIGGSPAGRIVLGMLCIVHSVCVASRRVLVLVADLARCRVVRG